MTAVTLYQLSDKYRALVEQLSDLDIDAQTVADTLEASGITDEIAVKAQSLEVVARTLEMHNPAIDYEIGRLKTLKEQRQRAASSLRDYLRTNMIAAGIDKIDTPLFKLSIRDNPPAVEVFDPLSVPAAFMRQPEAPPPTPDKSAIKDALKAGQDVPGCRLTRGTRLEVK